MTTERCTALTKLQRSKTKGSDVDVIADRSAYDVQLQTIKPVSVATAGTHDSIQRVLFMNAPKLNPVKRD